MLMRLVRVARLIKLVRLSKFQRICSHSHFDPALCAVPFVALFGAEGVRVCSVGGLRLCGVRGQTCA
jgi:hypothetical protein